MKVLLLGDFSGFHLNLAAGLRYHNVDVTVASSGDGFKNYSYDVPFRVRNRTKIQKKEDHLNFRKWIDEYDVIQMINVGCLDVNMTLCLYIRAKFKKAKVFCCTVGCDYVFWTEGRKVLNIPLFEEAERANEFGPTSLLQRSRFELVRRSVDGFLGVYEYHEAYHAQKKRLPMVLQPLNLSDLAYHPINLNSDEKIVIYHGIQKNREGFKGSSYILQAFEIAKKKYPEYVECITTTSLPYQDYLNIVKKVHVIFDQTNAHSHGMAALEAMGMGKVVASCSQDNAYWDRWLNELNIKKKPPLLRLIPDDRQILSQIEWIIENKAKLNEMSLQGREYVEQYHDCKKVASLFLERWGDIKQPI